MSLDKWSGIVDHTGMTDQTVPDYQLERVLPLETPGQLRALLNETRHLIIDMLSERAATTSQLAKAMGKPKGTVGHHLKTLEAAGLVRVVRTEKVRALEAKYYGRTARTFDLSLVVEAGGHVDLALTRALKDMAETARRTSDRSLPGISTVRHARIPIERAREWQDRLAALVEEFIATPRAGETVYGLVVALYPTERPHLT
jgi:DNA-binding transcriptional ArsR family regulator